MKFKPFPIVINYPKKGTKAIMYKGKPLGISPRSLTHISICSHNIGNNYNPHYMHLYKNVKGDYIYEIYRDGCLVPFYGKIKIHDNE